MANTEYSSAQCKYYDICGRDVEGNPVDGLCILHSTDSAKDTDAFAEALAAHRERTEDHFTRFVFPGIADFNGARFSRGVDFYEARFSGIADFGRATFSGRADFFGARFSKDADFGRATFSEDTRFIGARFSGIASFNRATFSKDADFIDARFSKDAGFGGATFSEDTRFFGARFSGGADFYEASFKDAGFGGARFSGIAGFNRAMFSGIAGFFEARFSGGAGFIEARFSGRAGFSGARFSEIAGFIEARFSEDADFSRATFSKDADFSQARFSGIADFSEATFSGETYFYRATFSGRTRFAGRLGSAEAAGDIFAGTEVDFRQVVIDPPDAATFLEADLTKCQFQDTDLRKVQMVGEKWPQTYWYWHKISRRTVVYDECLLWKEKKDRSTATRSLPWSQIERLYRELKQNYEDRRDYERAGDFHYGEKEMRRQNPDSALGLRFFLTLYCWFSGYGERYLRPLLWAGLLFVLSTIGYMWWGLRLKDGSSSLAWTYPWINPWDWLRAAYYSFRVMTLLQPDDWVPLRYAQLVNTFQTLLGPTFLGLFALALRQRLKR